MFDACWNHHYAIPYQQLSGQTDDGGARLAEVRETLKDNTEVLSDTPYADAVRDSLEDFIADDKKQLTWAPYQLIFDSPDKALGSEEAEETPGIVTPLLRSVRSADKSLLVVSPYFVPRSKGVKGIAELQDSGVQIEIVTNSLASSDHILVHSGYAAARKPLLEHGVKFCEVRGNLHLPGTEDSGNRGTKSSLHTKAFVVDQHYFFMGSFNWDPRSADINTELGIIIKSPEIATWISNRYYAQSKNICYRPFLDEQGRLRWRERNGDQVEVLSKEPDTTWFQRLKATLGRALPIRGQL